MFKAKPMHAYGISSDNFASDSSNCSPLLNKRKIKKTKKRITRTLSISSDEYLGDKIQSKEQKKKQKEEDKKDVLNAIKVLTRFLDSGNF